MFVNTHSLTVSPWTITHRPFENNVHKIAYAVLPLLLLLRLANPGPAGVALGVTFLVGSLMSNVSWEIDTRERERGRRGERGLLLLILSNTLLVV